MSKWSDDLDDAYNKGVQAGEEYERDRIIKLLKEHAPVWGFDGVDCLDECTHADWVAHFTALIQGDNK